MKTMTNWIPLTNIKELAVGTKIRFDRNGNSINGRWLTGIIAGFYLLGNNTWTIDIYRDDGQTGGGYNDSWNTSCPTNLFHTAYQIEVREWDE